MLTFAAAVLLIMAAIRLDGVSRSLSQSRDYELLEEGMPLSDWMEQRLIEKRWWMRRFFKAGILMLAFAFAASGFYFLNLRYPGEPEIWLPIVLFALLTFRQFLNLCVAGYQISRS